MIKQILNILAMNEWYNISEEVDIAKGKYMIPRNMKEGYKQGLRKGYGRY